MVTDHYCEAAAQVLVGEGFFRVDSRPARDFGVLLLRWLARQQRSRELTVLDGMAGCGIRSVRYGLEAGATELWVNDADPERLPLLDQNLAALPHRPGLHWQTSKQTIQKLLANFVLQEKYFDFVDIDAFGAATSLLPAALGAVRLGGVLYLASSDGRSFTGHDRAAAVRRLGAAVRAQPCSWELALRLQLGAIARAAWAMGHGLKPLLSFSEGRTFRTAVQLTRRPAPQEEALLGLQAYCHKCGNHWGTSLLAWKSLGLCSCGAEPVCSGPLWRGPLQSPEVLSDALALEQAGAPSLAPMALKKLQRLINDPAQPAEAFALADLARHLQGGLPRLEQLLAALRAAGWRAAASGIEAMQFRTDAPWAVVLRLAR
ncbi:N2,N2-dimethylguanosine tRNA methyltransferase [Synechococcus sp.]|uniref:N2,N2-dimethylguanosine tRNA methyltransferase n=1 Tax=Synechococcus sp. TaxID=1131 RepID=UPI0034A231AE